MVEEKEKLTLADQYVPLMLDGYNPKILYCLLYSKEKGVLVLNQKIIAELTEIENSQELTDRINNLGEYGLIERKPRIVVMGQHPVGIWGLTEMGESAAKFVEKFTLVAEEEAHKKTYEGLPKNLSELGEYLVSLDLRKIRENVDWYSKQHPRGFA